MTTIPKSTQTIGAFDQQSEVLQSCLAALEAKQTTVEGCIQQFPEFAELSEMLYASTFLKQLPPVSLTQSSRANVQSRMMQRYQERKPQPVKNTLDNRNNSSRPAILPRARWSVSWSMALRPLVALIVVVLLFYSGGSSLMFAASKSIPGETLYGVKRTAENVELSFTSGESRVSLLNSLANIRLDEVGILINRGITLTEPIISDVTNFVQQALSVHTNSTLRDSLAQRTVSTFDTAQRAGLLSADLENKMMTQLDSTLNPTSDPSNQADINEPTPSALTADQTTATATPGPNNSKPTHKPRPTKIKGTGNGNPPKGGK